MRRRIHVICMQYFASADRHEHVLLLAQTNTTCCTWSWLHMGAHLLDVLMHELLQLEHQPRVSVRHTLPPRVAVSFRFSPPPML
jgi:Ni,Fe-hydrogenase I small subunit